jgi:hypothetical protein
VFFGVEIASNQGDILAYGIKRVPPNKRDAEEVINLIHKQDGVAVSAHPYSERHNAFHDGVFNYHFDAIEINGAIHKKANNQAKRAAKIMDLPTIGGSDAHSQSQLNTFATKFQNRIYSIRDIVSAVRNKKCKAVRI